MNFLALLGWSPGTDQEVFTREELIAAFSLDGISGGNAVFNPEKLDWFNQQHIARLTAEEIATRLEPQLRDAGLWRDTFAAADRGWLLRVIELLKPRAKKSGSNRGGRRALLIRCGAVRRWGGGETPGITGDARASRCAPGGARLSSTVRSVNDRDCFAHACQRTRDQGCVIDSRDTCGGHRKDGEPRTLRGG